MKVFILESEVSIRRRDNQSPGNLESPMGSFLSLNSEQSSEREENDCCLHNESSKDIKI